MADLLVCALVKAGLSTPASLVEGLALTRSSSSTKRSSPAVLARGRSAVYLAPMGNPFDARSTLEFSEGALTLFRLDAVAKAGLVDLDRLPFSIRVLLENVLRHAGNGLVGEEHVAAVAQWAPEPDRSVEVFSYLWIRHWQRLGISRRKVQPTRTETGTAYNN